MTFWWDLFFHFSFFFFLILFIVVETLLLKMRPSRVMFKYNGLCRLKEMSSYHVSCCIVTRRHFSDNQQWDEVRKEFDKIKSSLGKQYASFDFKSFKESLQKKYETFGGFDFSEFVAPFQKKDRYKGYNPFFWYFYERCQCKHAMQIAEKMGLSIDDIKFDKNKAYISSNLPIPRNKINDLADKVKKECPMSKYSNLETQWIQQNKK